MAVDRHQEALTKAEQLVDNGYSASYVYEKLLKEGFSADEAKASLEALTNKPFNPEEAPAEAEGLVTPKNLIIVGVVLLVLGILMSLLLPPDWRILAYVILVAAPLMILVAAFRANS